MNEHYDVAVYGLWYGNNYGSMITYYALSRVLDSMNLSYAMIKNPLGSNLDVSLLPKSHPLRFASEHYKVTPLYRLSEMNKLNDMFDIFLLGSDQMWNYDLSKPYGQSYFFEFVSAEKNKIAYGTSFGKYPYNGPDQEKPVIRKNLKRFNSISVRDDFSQRICREDYDIDAQLVCDPVFLCDIEKYNDLANKSDLSEAGNPFYFAYVLDANIDFGNSIKKICKESGKRAVVIFDQLRYSSPHDIKQLAGLLGVTENDPVTILDDPPVDGWLYCFKNADFVITDSFHGVCFSIIYKKNFIVNKNDVRGGGRFPFLLRDLGLIEHMAVSYSGIVDLYAKLCAENKFQIDYDSVDKILDEKRNRSFQWLKSAIENPLKKTEVVEISKAVQLNLDIKMCTGCSACINICPEGALKLKPDEYGYYRSSIDDDKCINCGLCTAVCPAIKLPDNKNSVQPELYEFVASDEQVLWNSSSGGAFPLLAAEAFKRGGVVVGAAWRDDFTVEHIMIDKPEELYKLQKSKYLQTYMGDIYTQTKQKLEEGVFVLFTACPCQIAGLKAFLGKDYDNLIMVDLLCGNSPSAGFFKKYLDEEFPAGLEKYEFRHKAQGWTWNCTAATANGAVSVRRGEKQDNYQRVYHNHVMCPPHCEKCKYQAVPRFGDISIGDFWGIKQKDSSVDASKGVSTVLCNNEKGKNFFMQIPQQAVKVRKQVPLNWLGGNGYAINGSHNYCSPKRDSFYNAIKTMPFSKAINYALKPNHGIYPKPNIFNYQAKAVHFSFDKTMWDELYVNGTTVLTTKTMYPPLGNYCILSLSRQLDGNKKYSFRIRFKASTDSPELNFHVKDSGTRIHQVIHTHRVTQENKNKWIELKKIFTPDCSFYDEFMIGASHICGENRYIAIDYITIGEV